METISISVEREIAQAYHNASPEEQHQMQIMLNHWLKQILDCASLNAVIQDLQNQAQQNNLTQEILDQILSEDEDVSA